MSLIQCECCGKKISEDSINCINCGHPINKSVYEFNFRYQYKGKILNDTIVFRDEINKLYALERTRKVNVYNKTYKIKEIICSAHDNNVFVILDDSDNDNV